MPETLNPEGPDVAALLDTYHPILGVPDELLDAKGTIRPAWQPLINHLSQLSAEDVTANFARADQYLADAGVYYRQYGDASATVRNWPLSHMPVVIAEDEWQTIAAGLTQRADLLEALAADLYGPNQLVANGHLPATLIAQSPEWLQPLVGIKPRGGHFLHFLAFEIGRGPDGTWWVLGDRTQAPSGAGFALENRVASMRSYAEIYADSHVHRLAGFFRAFREALHRLKASGSERIGILTPGTLSDTYYEHAYIARYLGMTLLEGDDLTVENGRLFVRTVSGLNPISVLWRRLDADWADPLELNENSHIGTPGMVAALRENAVTMVNALGVGVLESRALMAFLPKVARELGGEPLKLPNVATWWCGQPSELDYVRKNADKMFIGPATSTRLPFEIDGRTAMKGEFIAGDAGSLDEWLQAEGARLVGQEAVTLSTTPVYEDGKLVPRPMSLRVYLARTPSGWTVMPGGYARIGASDDPTATALRRGGSVADVWVVGPGATVEPTLLSEAHDVRVQAEPGVLPSRAADNLFWLGRYVERLEMIMRLVRAYHGRLSENPDPHAPLLEALAEQAETYGVDITEPVPQALIDAISSAVDAAAQVRDRFSHDGWMALTDLQTTANILAAAATPGDNAARTIGVLLRRVTGLSGLVRENMYRFTGWRFLSLGRSLERSIGLCAILAVFGDDDAPTGGLDLVLEISDSTMSHRRRFSVTTIRETVVDLVALDPLNPRSIAYQLTETRDQIALLPHREALRHLSPVEKAALQVHTKLAVATPGELDTDALWALRGDILDLSQLISSHYLA